MLVALVTARQREFRPFLEVDHDRQRETGAARPTHRRRLAAIAAVVALGWLVDGHVVPQKSASRRRPTRRSPMKSASTASRISPVEMAAMVGSGLSSTYCSIWIGNVLVQ